MGFAKFKNWVSDQIAVNKRLKKIGVAYVIFLMVAVQKHSLEEASRFAGMNKSQFSRFLKKHSKLAVYTLDNLSKKQAKQFSKVLKQLKGVPWSIAILIDSTLQRRSTLHTCNAKRFHHGKGFVVGHQWTNIVLLVHDCIVPLPPIPYYSKKYCRQNKLEYKTENALVVEYIAGLHMEDYLGSHKPEHVLVLADSGYDDKKIETAIIKKQWKFIVALNKTRSVKSEKEHAITTRSKGWTQIAEFFKRHRRIGWQNIRILTNGSKRKRMDFRIRQIIGHLRYVGKVQLICSEFRKRPDGRRKYLACNDLKATARQIVIGYRLRWRIEIFHKEVKSRLGFEDIAPQSFTSVMAHVHWVYCAYILLQHLPPGLSMSTKSLTEKQRKLSEIVGHRDTSRIIQLLTQIDGAKRYKTELRTALQAI